VLTIDITDLGENAFSDGFALLRAPLGRHGEALGDQAFAFVSAPAIDVRPGLPVERAGQAHIGRVDFVHEAGR
jgi:hypothetical protein